MKYYFSLLISVLTLSAFGQTSFTTFNPSESEIATQQIKSKKAIYYTVDLAEIKAAVSNAPYRENNSINQSSFTISVPDLEGTMQTFKILRNQTMHPDYNALFPEIISFDGINILNAAEKAKFDITPQGFHAMIYNPEKSTLFIDPISSTAPNKVMVYSKKDFYTNKLMACDFHNEETSFENLLKGEIPSKILLGSCQLRTYRLAIAATTEYTTFQGGTVALAAAAQVTTMNRVNGVYERDMAITMVIIPNNNLIIYAGSDPYTNGTPNLMINENQTNVTSVIGSSNYDIGHVFGTNSGGLAGLGVVCNSTNKARGVTGSSAPVGDPFDIDYVAHEMGHQFKANHTQNNNCNRNNATAVEPGSASTIMGYAGICPPNIQNNSDDHFHGVSLKEISDFITGGSHTCPVISALTNVAPVISSTNGNVSIPANTPFALTAIATDADGDPLTYNWEQMNNEVSTQSPVATSTSGPNFRSNSSLTSPTRYFPKLSSIVSGGPFTWEIIPSVSRTMNFRCVVRDNAAGGGCADYKDVTVSTVASAGPFVVTYPNATGITWGVGSSQTVTWNVANTTAAPINATNVSIFLSTDGGLTFPTLLLSGTANDGTETIVVPNSITTTARIMVISSAGTFFDISNNNFAIVAGSPCNQPTIPVITGPSGICAGEPVSLSLTGTLNDATGWQWYSGSCGGSIIGTGTTLNVLPTVTTTYYARGFGGCVSTGSCGSFTVTVTQLNTNVNQVGNTLFSLQPTASTSYQWLNCGNSFAPIVGATSQNYVATAPIGSYAVKLTKNGCVDTSLCFVINQSGIEDINGTSWTISPNPTHSKAQITWADSYSVESIHLLDAQGKLVARITEFDENNAVIDLEKFETAMYFVQIRHQFGVQTIKFRKE